MAGNIFAKEFALVQLQNNNGASIASAAYGSATTLNLDNRSGGITGAESFWANFVLTAGFGSGPAVLTTIDLYLIPAIAGTNFAALAASSLPYPNFAGSFVVQLSQTAVQRMTLVGIPLMPLLYTAYLLNNTAQTISTNWGLAVVPAMEQYS